MHSLSNNIYWYLFWIILILEFYENCKVYKMRYKLWYFNWQEAKHSTSSSTGIVFWSCLLSTVSLFSIVSLLLFYLLVYSLLSSIHNLHGQRCETKVEKLLLLITNSKIPIKTSNRNMMEDLKICILFLLWPNVPFYNCWRFTPHPSYILQKYLISSLFCQLSLFSHEPIS